MSKFKAWGWWKSNESEKICRPVHERSDENGSRRTWPRRRHFALESGADRRIFRSVCEKKIEVLAGVDPDPLPRRQPSAAASFAPLPAAEREGDGSLVSELEEVKALIRQFNARSSSLLYPPPLAEAERRLVRQGMAEVYVRQVMDRLLERWYADKDGRSPAAVAAWTKEAVRDLLSPLPFVKTAEQKSIRFCLVRPGLEKRRRSPKWQGGPSSNKGKKSGSSRPTRTGSPPSTN
ncbi:hypothetical protein LR69_01806 [Geobacillus sp. BCO2]|nr:hypothetical protein LR69_01806 [Geobacillus sp. BCO2]